MLINWNSPIYYFGSPEKFSGKKGPYWACRDTDPFYTHAYIREGP